MNWPMHRPFFCGVNLWAASGRCADRHERIANPKFRFLRVGLVVKRRKESANFRSRTFRSDLGLACQDAKPDAPPLAAALTARDDFDDLQDKDDFEHNFRH